MRNRRIFYQILSQALTPGTPTYTWGSGADVDSVTVNSGSVPDPSSLAMAGIAVATWLVVARRRP